MMEDYKRLTDKEHKYKGCVDCTYKNCQYCDDIVEYEKEAYNRLCDFEDKIENGTLVEFPRVIHPNRMEWFVQYQYPNGVIQYHICFSEAEAKAKLRELKGEQQ